MRREKELAKMKVAIDGPAGAGKSSISKRAAKALGFTRTFIADPHDGTSCFTCSGLFDKSVIVIGSEANGVTCHPDGSENVIIPMPGDYESLNAAQAATVLLLEYVRRTTI